MSGEAATDVAAPLQAPPRRLGRAGRRELPGVWLTRVGHGLLWLLVAAGAVGGVAGVALHAQADPAAADGPPPAPAPSVAAQGFAELYVRVWLGEAGRGAEDAIAAFYPGPVRLSDVTPGGVYVLHTTTVTAEEETPGYWAVTVAATVLTAVDGVYEPAGVRYYTVGVVDDDGTMAATGLPSQVQGPATLVDAPEPAVAALSPASGEAWAEAVERFLAAFLAGAGELDRYTAPGSELTAIVPPPFVEVEVLRAGAVARSDGSLVVRAEAAVVDAGGLTQVLHYSADVVERAGRWEVTELHRAPPLSSP